MRDLKFASASFSFSRRLLIDLMALLYGYLQCHPTSTLIFYSRLDNPAKPWLLLQQNIENDISVHD